MSASITPTVKPFSASAAAKFTVTVDLPTPPFPEATISTLVVAGISVSGASWRILNRARAMVAAFSSWVSSVQEISTEDTPGILPARVRTSRWI